MMYHIKMSLNKLIKIFQENSIDAITLLTVESDDITNKRKNIIIQYHQLRRQITNEFEAENVSNCNSQLQLINSCQNYQSGINHSASNTTTKTATDTTNETNETSNKITVTANAALISIKFPILFIYLHFKVFKNFKKKNN